MPRPPQSVSLAELAHLVELFRTHRPRLEAIFTRKIQHTPLAGTLEVIFQEAYLLAVPRWSEFLKQQQTPDGFVWLYGVVRDAWIAEVRRHEGVIVDASTNTWITADGGQGASGFDVGYTKKRLDPSNGNISGAREPGTVFGWIDLEELVKAS